MKYASTLGPWSIYALGCGPGYTWGIVLWQHCLACLWRRSGEPERSLSVLSGWITGVVRMQNPYAAGTWGGHTWTCRAGQCTHVSHRASHQRRATNPHLLSRRGWSGRFSLWSSSRSLGFPNTSSCLHVFAASSV